MPVDAKRKDEVDLDFEFIPVSVVRGPMERAAKKTLIFSTPAATIHLRVTLRDGARCKARGDPAGARAARWAGCIQECGGGGRPALDCNVYTGASDAAFGEDVKLALDAGGAGRLSQLCVSISDIAMPSGDPKPRPPTNIASRPTRVDAPPAGFGSVAAIVA